MVPSLDPPRERLQAHGAAPLADAELLSLVLGNRSTSVANGLLAAFPDLHRMANAGIAELATVDGMGVAQACRLKAALALAGRLGERPHARGEALGGPAAVAKRMAPRMAHLEREVLMALAVDVKNRVIGEIRLAEGGVSRIDLLLRDAFTPLVREAATSAIFIHNHPSGDPTPSPDDVALTLRLDAVGKLVGVTLLDHVIVASDGYRAYSEGWR